MLVSPPLPPLLLAEIIGRRVKRYRESAGLTQQQLAQHIRQGHYTISRIESGKGRICVETLYSIAHFFDISLSELVDIKPLTSLDISVIANEEGIKPCYVNSRTHSIIDHQTAEDGIIFITIKNS